MLYSVKEESNYKSARNMYLIVFAFNYFLLVLYVILNKKGKVHGVSINLNNSQNLWNKFI